MTTPTTPIESERRPDIFSRETIELTFALLRDHSPGLALKVRNLLSGETAEQAGLSEQSEHFPIILDGPSIEEVITALTEISETEIDQPDPEPGKLMLLKALLQDWLGLAKFLIAEKILQPKNDNDC